jgi:hypothetical protein
MVGWPARVVSTNARASGAHVKEFLVQSVLPLAAVCALVAGLTLALFDVPADAPEGGSPAAAASTRVAASSQTPVEAPLGRNVRRERMNEVLARAAVAFDGNHVSAQPAGAEGFGAGVAQSPAAANSADPRLQGALASLSDAIRLARNARTEQDLLRAEEQLRAARLEMDASCRKMESPLCEGARQMRALGF